MAATTLQLIPSDDMISIKAEIKEIKTLLEQRPEALFQLKWVESKKIPSMLGISNRTWQSWRDKRMVPFSQFGAKIYVKLDDLNTLFESHLIENPKTF